jgi:NADPH:quinone reductase-like Zn-dependent oxidoreductase
MPRTFSTSATNTSSPRTPSDVGAEGVGRVVAVGPGENESLVGSRVLLLPTYRHGTWATHVIAAATDIVVVPEDLDTVQLAMVGINPMTALLMLRNFGDRPPEKCGNAFPQVASAL